VVEFGAGVGAAALALARRTGAIDLTLVEMDGRLAALARENAARNDLTARVLVLDVDAKADAFVAAGLAPDSVDHVLMNPPFNDADRHQPSPDVQRRSAHHAAAFTIETWSRAALRILKPGGRLTLIWRADGLAAILAALSRGFGSIAVLPVHPKPEMAAIRVLVVATKGSRAPLTILPELLLADAAGAATPQAQAISRGEAVVQLSKR